MSHHTPSSAQPGFYAPPGSRPPAPSHQHKAQRPWYKKKRFIIPLALIALLFIIGVIVSGGEDAEPTAVDEVASPAPIEETAQVEDDAPAEQDEAPDDDEAEGEQAAPEGSASQQNALRSAENYLRFAAFSESGLIEQLEFEGFITDDATWAVSQMDVDWVEQAKQLAENYLDLTGFSESGLIEQLEFEGFSTEQAQQGLSQITVDWNEQAAKSAQSYSDFVGLSRDAMIDQLMFDGYTAEQAAHGAAAVGL